MPNSSSIPWAVSTRGSPVTGTLQNAPSTLEKSSPDRAVISLADTRGAGAGGGARTPVSVYTAKKVATASAAIPTTRINRFTLVVGFVSDMTSLMVGLLCRELDGGRCRHPAWELRSIV